jgi:hypothetical protein
MSLQQILVDFGEKDTKMTESCESCDSSPKSNQSSKSCNICMDSKLSEHFYECRHKICYKCFSGWMNTNIKNRFCPYCAKPVKNSMYYTTRNSHRTHNNRISSYIDDFNDTSDSTITYNNMNQELFVVKYKLIIFCIALVVIFILVCVIYIWCKFKCLTL